MPKADTEVDNSSLRTCLSAQKLQKSMHLWFWGAAVSLGWTQERKASCTSEAWPCSFHRQPAQVGLAPSETFKYTFASRFPGSPWVTCPANPADPSPMGRRAWNSWAGYEIKKHDDLKSHSPGERCWHGCTLWKTFRQKEASLIYIQTSTSSGNQGSPLPRLRVPPVISVLLLHRNRSKNFRSSIIKLKLPISSLSKW